MASLTITVDEEVLVQARIRALQMGTSVDALVSDYLERFANIRARQTRAVDDFLAKAAAYSDEDLERARRRGGRRWTRADLHER